MDVPHARRHRAQSHVFYRKHAEDEFIRHVDSNAASHVHGLMLLGWSVPHVCGCACRYRQGQASHQVQDLRDPETTYEIPGATATNA